MNSIKVIKENEVEGQQLLVGTHNGVFHADDVFFIATLALVQPNLCVVRTRTPAVLDKCQIVGDVGGIYGSSNNRYDHHQRGGAGARPNGVPYAAFGLLWKNTSWILDLLGMTIPAGYGARSEIMRRVDESLVQAVDAADNGYSIGEDTTPRYSVSAAISAFNPNWDEEADFDSSFVKAVEFAQGVLLREIASADAAEKAVVVVRRAIALQHDEPEILALDQFCPWQDTVIAEGPKVKFVVFPSETGDYRVQAVPDAPGSFGMREPLPAAWAGLRGAELARAVRVSGGQIGEAEAVFCHAGKFIAGATTFEAAMQMARAALNAPWEDEISKTVGALSHRA